MKGPIKSVLSVALAMATSQVFALGLGPIQIKSGLNQPLLAEIPVVADTAAEVEDLRVGLASAEDFQRVGLSRARVTVPIEFSVASNGRGQKVIRLTTKEVVREPFLDFLIEASWSKGKLLREYSVLLDPPVTAPAVLATAPKVAEKPKPVEATPRAPASQPREETPKPVAQAAPVSRSAPAAAAAPAPAKGEYTVQRGDTLSQIANEVGDNPQDFNRTLLALYKANPEAFYRDNMNALKTGAVLRIPTSAEVRAAGSLNEAAAAVRAQQQSWQGLNAATLVANTGAAPATDKPAAAAAGQKHGAERLALVPPSASTGNETGTSHGGSAEGSKDAAALRADLSRTKEALTSRDQESSELKSRVAQLEDINNKSQRLISLKDSEIAELQNKLRQLEAGKGITKPGETAAAEQAAKQTASAAPTPAPTTPAAPTPTPAAPAAAAPTPASGSVSAAPATAPPAGNPPAATPAAAEPSAVAANQPAAPATPPPSPAPKPAAAVAKPATPPAAAKPWYADYVGDNPYLVYGGAGGVLLLLAGWLLKRASGGKKPNPRPAIAAMAVADSEAVAEDPHAQLEPESEIEHHHDGAPDADAAYAEPHAGEDDEMEQLRHHFDDGDSDRFVALAHELHEKYPEDSAEWQEVAELGRQLLPGSPLFAAAAYVGHGGHDPDNFFFDEEPGSSGEIAAAAEIDAHDTRIKAMDDLDEPLAFEPHGHPGEKTDELRHMEFKRELDKHLDLESEQLAEEENGGSRQGFLDEDTIGTRLDLARAYLDMGDPEGARSMLDEVLSEGSAAQKEEARKLLAELS